MNHNGCPDGKLNVANDNIKLFKGLVHTEDLLVILGTSIPNGCVKPWGQDMRC